MKAAIIVPPYPLAEAPAPPLGVSYVAAAMEAAGAEVRIFDYLVRRYSPDKLRRELDIFRPHLIGTTSVTLNFPDAASILSQAKQLRPEALTVMGGPHVSFTAHETLSQYPGIDLIVMGEGEATVRELLPLVAERESPDKVKGIAYRRKGEIIINEPRDFIEDLDSLPLPARHLLPLSRYQALGYPISIITGRGCPYSCIFCQGRRMVGKKIRKRTPCLVVDEIEQILAYGINRINIADDLFASERKRVEEICGEILKRGLTFAWSAFARVNTVDRETLRIMREAGCDAVSFGVESGNGEILKKIRKSITLEMVREAVNLCKEVGIIPHTSFMVGLPGESRETLEETRSFAASLGSLYGYHHLAPFPGTTIREEANRYEIEILTDDWSRYDANGSVVRTAHLDPEEMNEFVARFEQEIAETWEEMVEGYGKTNSPETDLAVRGHFRMELTHRLLAEDLIETCSETTSGSGDQSVSFKALCEKIASGTSFEIDLIEETIGSFIDSGYLKKGEGNGRAAWFWTHNLRSDFPGSGSNG